MAVAAVGGFIAVVAAFGCDRCGSATPEVTIEPDERSLKGDVAAVARLSNFERRNFDLQHWWAVAVERGAFRGRDDLDDGVPDQPAAELKALFERSFSGGGEQFDWEGDVDIAVWRPAEGDQRWRWAVSVPLSERAAIGESVNWDQVGYARKRSAGDADSAAVFRRSDGAEPLYFAEVDSPDTGQQQRSGRAVTLANFPGGAVRVAEMVEQVGESGTTPAELYLWPRRTGIAERYAEFADRLDHNLAVGGERADPVRLGWMRLRAELWRAAGEPEFWPELVRVSMDVERDAESPAVQRAEFSIDVMDLEGAGWRRLLSAIGFDDTARRFMPPDAVDQIDVAIDGTEALLEGRARHLLELMSPRNSAVRQEVFDDLTEVVGDVSGLLTVATFESPVPAGGTAETLLVWETEDPEGVEAALDRLHPRVFPDYWMPILNLAGPVFEHADEVEIDGESIELRGHAFAIGHGFGAGGACWTERDGRFSIYYGVRPCNALGQWLREQPAKTEVSAPSYRSRLATMVDRFYVTSGDEMQVIFGGIDVDWRAERIDGDTLRLSVAFDDVADLARLIEGSFHLRRWWSPESVVEPGGEYGEFRLDAVRFQEPGITAVGVPGMGGMLPGSYLLGMPFSYPPATPLVVRRHFFDEEPAEVDHGDHVHLH